MIPKILWMTHEDKYENLPSYIQDVVKTWSKKNPDYKIKYINSQEREEFILTYFGPEWLNRYNKSVSGSMKADIWKYLVIYQYGGVYTDIDYICNKPISYWCKDNMNMIIGADEFKNEIACHTYAASMRHPAIKSVLDVVYNNLKEIDFSIKFIPYVLTGPTAFTQGIKNFLNIENELDLFNNVEEINNSKLAIQNKVYCYGNKYAAMLDTEVVTHVNGRVNWYDGRDDWFQAEIKRHKEYMDNLTNKETDK